jgi:hypothetical protein
MSSFIFAMTLHAGGAARNFILSVSHFPARDSHVASLSTGPIPARDSLNLASQSKGQIPISDTQQQ